MCCLLLALLCLLSPSVFGIALLPNHVAHFSKGDANIILKDGVWRQVDFTQQYQHGKPPRPFDSKHESANSTILVLISSLRETRLVETLVSLFTQARYAKRVHVAIVQQNASGDEDIIVEYCREMLKRNALECLYEENIRVTRLLASEAKGPVYARALGNKLVDFERDDFCMQVDAHTLVARDWDVLLLEDWGKAENEYAILTTYPSNAKDLGVNGGGHWLMPHICCAHVDQVGILTNCQAGSAANLNAPLLAPLWAAGFSLSKCHAERAVPNDEKLVGVFAGEGESLPLLSLLLPLTPPLKRICAGSATMDAWV